MKALNTKLQELEERQEREGNVTQCKTKCKSDMFFVNSYYNITSTKACNTVTQSISGKKLLLLCFGSHGIDYWSPFARI